MARFYVARTPSDRIVLSVNPVLGRPEHHEYRWVQLDDALALVVPRLQIVLRWAAARMGVRRRQSRLQGGAGVRPIRYTRRLQTTSVGSMTANTNAANTSEVVRQIPSAILPLTPEQLKALTTKAIIAATTASGLDSPRWPNRREAAATDR